MNTTSKRKEIQSTNILISNFDRWYSQGGQCVSAVYIQERYSHTAIDDGYSEAVVVEGNLTRLRAAVAKALDYAREHALRVQINTPQVLEDIDGGLFDLSNLLIVDSAGRIVSDTRVGKVRSTLH